MKDEVIKTINVKRNSVEFEVYVLFRRLEAPVWWALLTYPTIISDTRKNLF